MPHQDTVVAAQLALLHDYKVEMQSLAYHFHYGTTADKIREQRRKTIVAYDLLEQSILNKGKKI